MSRHRAIGLLLGALALMPLAASAHLTGVSFQENIDEYAVDVGYSSAAPTVGESVLFDFLLRDKDSANSNASDVAFSDVWVRIEDITEGSTTASVVFASGIHNARFGGPRMSYVFPRAGEYRIYVRYENEESSIVEARFPLTVIPALTGGMELPDGALYGVGGLIIGAGAAYLYARRRTS